MGVFDIIGPVMIGPSSSHTAGAARMGRMARIIFGEQPVKALITLYGSFARTYRGHGTDKALVAGVLDLPADDPQLRDAFALAQQANLAIEFKISDKEPEHPNTASFALCGASGKKLRVTGQSLGGGSILISRIDDFQVEITGDYYTLVTVHRDKPGVIAEVTHILAGENINISQMKVSRRQRDAEALMIVETDQIIPAQALVAVQAVPAIESAIAFPPL